MRRQYVFSPQAAQDLVEIWRYLRVEANEQTANRVESVILERVAFLARTPRAGHGRQDLTPEDVRFFPVYSYLIVYRSEVKPVQIVAILHGNRDVAALLADRF